MGRYVDWVVYSAESSENLFVLLPSRPELIVHLRADTTVSAVTVVSNSLRAFSARLGQSTSLSPRGENHLVEFR